uniref:Uncharacterized protein n=1 Tax=Megaselia scalaris TaxID=36166 RepID=T1GP54_MEGSC
MVSIIPAGQHVFSFSPFTYNPLSTVFLRDSHFVIVLFNDGILNLCLGLFVGLFEDIPQRIRACTRWRSGTILASLMVLTLRIFVPCLMSHRLCRFNFLLLHHVKFKFEDGFYDACLSLFVWYRGQRSRESPFDPQIPSLPNFPIPAINTFPKAIYCL